MTPQHPDEVAADLFMAAASTLLTQGMDTLSEEKQEEFRRGLATGKLRITLDMPPLEFHVYVVDADDIERQMFTVRDHRESWQKWATDLAQRYQ